jgi:DNA modification methylase
VSDLSIDMESVDALIPYAANSRTHSDEQVAQIAASIKEFGWTNPILIDGDNVIIAGHGRLLAARKLGMEKVPIICIDHLTKAQQKALVIADNQLATNAGWDMDMLKAEIEGLKLEDFDVDLLGFDDKFLDGLLEPEPTEGLTDEDAVPEVPETPKTVLGDVWVLGNHRLMCGDSTSIDAVEKLMDGAKADMVFTDPPYGVSYDGGQFHSGDVNIKRAREKLKNDDVDLYEDAVKISALVCNGPVFMFYADTVPFGLYRGIEAVGGEVVALLIWKKTGGYGAMGASYKPNHEPCVIWKKKGSRLNLIGATTENRVWEEKKDGTNKLHPTQKPVSIAERAIRNHKAATVLDLFGGSGSTLIACEKTGRHNRMMELDPKYCDVIIKRWQDFTGKQAIHAETGEPFDASR